MVGGGIVLQLLKLGQLVENELYYDLIEKQWLEVIVYSSRLELTS